MQDQDRNMRKILLLGSGRMCGPAIEILCTEYYIIVASNVMLEADELVKNMANTETRHLDITMDDQLLEMLIEQVDIVISLLPLQFHVRVASLCIAARKSLVTASYTAPEMRQLHDRAVSAGVTLLNEMGLDPGIDHMLAHRLVDLVRDGAGTVRTFTSYCGGVPAPDTNMADNPLKYKFSWSPLTALMATMRPAKFYRDDKIVELAAGTILDHVSAMDASIFPEMELEGLPNGDSTGYRDMYGLQTATDFLRGSIRYKGYASIMRGLVKLGLLTNEPRDSLSDSAPSLTWRQFLCELVNIPVRSSLEELKHHLMERLDDSAQVAALEQFGLLSDITVGKCSTPVRALAAHLEKRLAYLPGERDLVLLRTVAEINWPSPRGREVYREQMVVYGDSGGHSAMAKCVGYTTAIGAKMILEGELTTLGVVVPSGAAVYRPVLERLEQLGIRSVRV